MVKEIPWKNNPDWEQEGLLGEPQHQTKGSEGPCSYVGERMGKGWKTESMAEATQCKAMLALPSRPTKKKHKNLNKAKDWEEKN